MSGVNLSAPLPKHVAVIMDGNGRWAESQNLSRNEGHRAGALAIDSLLETALEFKIKAVSLYAFSTENWKRPSTEIAGLFRLLDFFLEDKLPRMLENKIRIQTSGDIRKLPSSSRKLIRNAVEQTANETGMVVNFCLNYGSRQELLNAVALLLKEREKNRKKIGTRLTEKEFAKYLYTTNLPEVDLLIRTAGEKRLSNFMLYQLAYAELVFRDVLWPNFDRREFLECLIEFQNRTRKFGGLLK